MKARFTDLPLSALIALFVCACSTQLDRKYSIAPQINFVCDSQSAQGCTNTNVGKPVFIGLDLTLNTDCIARLTLMDGFLDLVSSFNYSSTVSAEALGATELTGITTQWVNSSYMPILQLPSETFKVCAFVDLNENKKMDLGEPYHESTLTVGSAIPSLSSWSNY